MPDAAGVTGTAAGTTGAAGITICTWSGVTGGATGGCASGGGTGMTGPVGTTASDGGT